MCQYNLNYSSPINNNANIVKAPQSKPPVIIENIVSRFVVYFRKVGETIPPTNQATEIFPRISLRSLNWFFERFVTI